MSKNVESPPRETGKYVVLEGGEGVGKTTQVELLVGRLALHGIIAEPIREPGGDPMGERIRELVLDEGLERLPETEVFLFNAARLQTLAKIEELKRSGVWAVADRSRLSTIAYQGYGHLMDQQWVRTICNLTIQGREPDLELLLWADRSVTDSRRQQRGTVDRFEAMDIGFHTRVEDGYLIEAKAMGIAIIEASGTIEEVAERIWLHIEPLLAEGASD